MIGWIRGEFEIGLMHPGCDGCGVSGAVSGQGPG